MCRRLLLIAAVAGTMSAFPWASEAQEKIEGKVLSTKLTICQFKPGGCAGSLVMETAAPRKPEQVTIRIPLGTMIKQGNDVVYLPALRGREVIVEVAADKGERVAKTISVK